MQRPDLFMTSSNSPVCAPMHTYFNYLHVNESLTAQTCEITQLSLIWMIIFLFFLIIFSLVFSLSVQPDVHWGGSCGKNTNRTCCVRFILTSASTGEHPLFMWCVSESGKWLILSILSLPSPTERWVRIRVKSGRIMNHPASTKQTRLAFSVWLWNHTFSSFNLCMGSD